MLPSLHNIQSQTLGALPECQAVRRRGRRPMAESERTLRREARRIFYGALSRGEVKRRYRCERCRRTNDDLPRGWGGLTAHHVDYTQPLLVQWLCYVCHRKADREMYTAQRLQHTAECAADNAEVSTPITGTDASPEVR
jgi:hypothetical protein